MSYPLAPEPDRCALLSRGGMVSESLAVSIPGNVAAGLCERRIR
jgi:hypothetical protein